MNPKSRILWLLLGMLLASATSSAATPTPAPGPNWYDVEMIVFENTGTDAGSLESWPSDPSTPAWTSAQPLNPAGSNLPYRQLPPTSYRLNSTWYRLAHAPGYAPLLHIAWAQPAIDRASAPFVQVSTPPAAQGTVYGIAKLSTTGPYLHFDLDLLLCGPAARSVIPASTSSAQAAPAQTVPGCQPYRLRQNRKLDAGRLNYFDSPMFGALVLVTPRTR